MDRPDVPVLQVVLVGDDAGPGVIVREILKSAHLDPYHLTWLPGFDEALHSVLSISFDVCLVDSRIGDHSGIEFLTATCESRCIKPVILLNGFGDDIRTATTEEAADILFKGDLTPQRLERSIRYVVERGHALEALRDARKRADVSSLVTNEFVSQVASTLRVSDSLWGRLDPDQREFVASFREAANSLLTLNGEILAINGDLETALRRRTAELEESLGRISHYRGLVESIVEFADDAIMAKDLTGRVMSFNAASERLFGYVSNEILGQSVMLIVPADKENEELSMIGRIRRGEHIADYETVRQCKDGRLIPVSVRMSPLKDESDHISGASTIIRDITERKKTQQFVLDALREKDVLLREIHHRVKNNLSIVSSLLYLQSTRATDATVTGFFQEAQSRIRSMALVHEALYSSENLAAVDFGPYVLTLAQTLFRTFGISESHIQLIADAQPVFLPVEHAIPCGLVMNELLSNALKHAFPNGREGGSIRISVHKDSDGLITLGVRDDGIGTAVTVPRDGKPSLGLHLVRTLTKQLEGNFELTNCHPGTTAALTFKVAS